MVFIGKPCHVCKYQPWLTNEYHQKKMIFSIFDCCPSFLTCVGGAVVEIFTFHCPLSLLHCNSVCVHCQPRVWHLFMLSVWEKRRQEKGSPVVISTTIFSLLITTGDLFLRPHDQVYHQEMIVSISDLYDICRYICLNYFTLFFFFIDILLAWNFIILCHSKVGRVV